MHRKSNDKNLTVHRKAVEQYEEKNPTVNRAAVKKYAEQTPAVHTKKQLQNTMNIKI